MFLESSSFCHDILIDPLSVQCFKFGIFMCRAVPHFRVILPRCLPPDLFIPKAFEITLDPVDQVLLIICLQRSRLCEAWSRSAGDSAGVQISDFYQSNQSVGSLTFSTSTVKV